MSVTTAPEEVLRKLEFSAVEHRALEVERAALKDLHLRAAQLLVAEREAARSPAFTGARVRRMAKLVGEEATALAQRERLDKERDDRRLRRGCAAPPRLPGLRLLPSAAL